MEYMEFLDEVRDYINEESDNITVHVHRALKNNGVKLAGLSFAEEGCNASPTIYMEDYYSRYLKGEDICDIGDSLLKQYRMNSPAVRLDMTFFDNFESVKDRLYIKLINREKNADFLKEAPYEEFLDLAIVAYVRVYDRRIGNGVIMVRNEHLQLWNTDGARVLEEAKRNTHDHDDFNLRHIMDVLTSMGNGNLIQNGENDDFPMYVATNRKMTNGAAVMTMNDKLKEFSDVIGGDFYVIPSSVHELILFADNDGMACDINEMIREVNTTELSPDEVLSDHVYLYRASDEVLIF